MADATGAELDPSGKGSEQGLAQPAGESQGDGNASGDETVSKKQFLGALASANAKYETLQRELEQLKAEKAKPAPPKEATRAELDQLVASGDLTRAQAEDVLEKQTRAAARQVAKDEAGKLVAEAEYVRRVNTEMESYRELVPKAWEAGSPEYLRGVEEFNYLVSELGYQPGPATELAALRAAFGKLDTLRTSKSARRGPAETHEEAGGGDPENTDRRDESASLKLTAAQRAYYTKGIEQGRYKGWKDVAEELKYARR